MKENLGPSASSSGEPVLPHLFEEVECQRRGHMAHTTHPRVQNVVLETMIASRRYPIVSDVK